MPILRTEPRLVAAFCLIAGLIIMIVGLFTHEVVGSNGMELFAYSLPSIIALIVGAMLVAGSLVVILQRASIRTNVPVARVRSNGDGEAMAQGAVGAGESTPEAPERNHLEEDRLDIELVLRLLGGDERTVFRTIVDSGGAVFQKDLVNKTQMSDAKVSRVLDHLEAKDLVLRERQGMTNRVAIKDYRKESG